MSAKQRLQAVAPSAQQSVRATDGAHRPREVRCYLVADLLRELSMSRSTFFALRAAGKLPFLEELKPRIGRRVRFRAEPVDRWLANQWGEARSFRRIS